LSTNTPQTSINAVQSALGFWVPTVGTNNEPAITAANNTQQIMLSPPFKWAWNRNSFTLTTAVGTQDYTVAVTDFGYLETATLSYPGATRIVSLNIKNSTPLGESVDQQLPGTIAVLQNTVGTSIKVRFLGVPDKIYTCVGWYQKFVPLITSLSTTWTPPDYMAYIYNRGFLAELFLAGAQAAQAQQEKIAFAAGLIANSEGLTDTEINMFLAQYQINPRSMEVLQIKTQQGVQARGQQ
jgi:hypothetical protein